MGPNIDSVDPSFNQIQVGEHEVVHEQAQEGGLGARRAVLCHMRQHGEERLQHDGDGRHRRLDSIKTSAVFRTGFQKATSIRTGAANADFRRQKVECKKLCGFKIIKK